VESRRDYWREVGAAAAAGGGGDGTVYDPE